MSVKEELATGRLVWAKVEPYPWWPGKILKIIQQQHQPVFKIAFFADPTYTYLHQHQIIPYAQFDQRLNGSQEHHLALQRAIKMAQAHFNKLNNSPIDKDSLYVSIPSIPVSVPQQTEEFCQQNSMIPSQKEGSCSGLEQAQVSPMTEERCTDQITVQNVIDLLQREQTTKKRQGYCYQKRKQQIRYQDKLKEQLLTRYNLLVFDRKGKASQRTPSEQQVSQITAISNAHFIPKKCKKIVKGHLSRKVILNQQIDELSKRCIKKINVILKNSKDDMDNTRYNSMQIMRRILLLADNNHLKFKSLFVTLVKTIMGCEKGVSCEQRLCDFRHYLQRLQGEKGQDEEGSRITQIEATVN